MSTVRSGMFDGNSRGPQSKRKFSCLSTMCQACANRAPTMCQPCAHRVPTVRQPYANRTPAFHQGPRTKHQEPKTMSISWHGSQKTKRLRVVASHNLREGAWGAANPARGPLASLEVFWSIHRGTIFHLTSHAESENSHADPVIQRFSESLNR